MVNLGRRYNTGDLEEIRSWYEKRGMQLIPSLIPPVGFIVPGIAAGFMISTNTTAAILEPFIANPEVSEWERDTALRYILDKLVEQAAFECNTHVFGFSTSQTMIRRALDMGFKLTETSSTVVKEIA